MRRTLATPYLATSASRPATIFGDALSPSIRSASVEPLPGMGSLDEVFDAILQRLGNRALRHLDRLCARGGLACDLIPEHVAAGRAIRLVARAEELFNGLPV